MWDIYLESFATQLCIGIRFLQGVCSIPLQTINGSIPTRTLKLLSISII